MTTNEMIYKTINTKLTKEPKFKSVLEDMGYEVFDSDWSVYGNWTVKNPKTDRLVALSRSSHGGKRGLYGGCYCIKEGDIRKVNLVGYLGKENVDRSRADNNYLELAYRIRESERNIRMYEAYMKDCRDALDTWIKHYEEKCADYQSRIDAENARIAKIKGKVRARIEELKAGKVVKEIG